jgi:UTP--glucose-1-phosphate uridylyltransferase
MSKKIRKAVFPAAGLGTRFLPATKSSPKEMLPLVDKPLIQYGVEEAVASGIESILIITGRDKTAIENHFDISFELEQVLQERGKQKEMFELVRAFPTRQNQLYAAETGARFGTRDFAGERFRRRRTVRRHCSPTT